MVALSCVAAVATASTPICTSAHGAKLEAKAQKTVIKKAGCHRRTQLFSGDTVTASNSVGTVHRYMRNDVDKKWIAFQSAYLAWKLRGTDVDARVQRGEPVDLKHFKAEGVEVMRLAAEWEKAKKQKAASHT